MKILSCFHRCGQPRVRREPSFSSNCQTSSSLAPDCGKAPEKLADCDRLVTLNKTSAGVAAEFLNCASPFRSTYIEAIAESSILQTNATHTVRSAWHMGELMTGEGFTLSVLVNRFGLWHSLPNDCSSIEIHGRFFNAERLVYSPFVMHILTSLAGTGNLRRVFLSTTISSGDRRCQHPTTFEC